MSVMGLEKADIYYKILLNVDFVATQLVTAVCLALLCRNFFRNRRSVWFAGLTYFLLSAVLYYIPMEIGNFTAYAAAVFGAFLVMLLVDRESWEMKVFLAVTYFTVRWVAASLISTVSFFLMQALEKMVYQSFDVSGPDGWMYYFAVFCVYCLLSCILFAGLLFGVVTAVSRAFVYKHDRMSAGELLVLLLPSLLGMVCYELFLLYNEAFLEETGSDVYNLYGEIRFFWTLNQLAILAAIVSMIILYQRLKQKREEEHRRFVLESQIENMQSHIGKVEQMYAEMRGIRHDINNHICVLQSLMEQGNYEEARRYIRPLGDAGAGYGFSIVTGNPITDVIVNEKASEAALKGLIFRSDFRYPPEGRMDAFDVSIILNNALNNAIEASSPGGTVELSSIYRNNAWLITVMNTFQGEIVYDRGSRLPRTSKGDESVHGFGMKNIKAVAEKYYGDMELEQRNGSVKLTVLLMLNDA